MKRKGTKDLTLTQRRDLEYCLGKGYHKKEIAERLGVCLERFITKLNAASVRKRCTVILTIGASGIISK